ncbi:Centrosomal protein of 104 kDa [Oryzias melastigma]|uniref:Centrosomal protein of 104 kDa n=1 Tax=Oryzias melastigma TaxID=30732 RepID=A0A834C2Q7_ORYME|nr:Centrosomal protein of 104 kDa [Oryzias melastigma]
MQKKIKFSVISSSSHEDHFSAKELLVHAPTVRGWRSSRLSSFPQHVTIQLEQRSRIRKLQLLAHQFLIPTKVEFHVGDILPYSGSSELQLRRLGVGSGALEGEQRWEDELQVGISRTDVLIERWKQSFDKLMNEEHAGEDRVCVRVTQVDRRGHRDNGPEQQK